MSLSKLTEALETDFNDLSADDFETIFDAARFRAGWLNRVPPATGRERRTMVARPLTAGLVATKWRASTVADLDCSGSGEVPSEQVISMLADVVHPWVCYDPKLESLSGEAHAVARAVLQALLKGTDNG